MEQGLIGKAPKYNAFFLFAGFTFVISSLLYLIYAYATYFIDWRPYMNSMLPDILLNIVPGLLFFIVLTVFAFFLSSGKNMLYISVFTAILTVLSAIWIVFLIINSIENIFVTLAAISDSDDIVMAILNTVNLVDIIATIFTMLAIILSFGIILGCNLIARRNPTRIFIWIFPKLSAIIMILLAVLKALFFNLQLAIIALAYPSTTIGSFDDWLSEFDRLFNNSTIAAEFYIITFILLGIGTFILSCGLNYHSKGVRPNVIVGTKIME